MKLPVEVKYVNKSSSEYKSKGWYINDYNLKILGMHENDIDRLREILNSIEFNLKKNINFHNEIKEIHFNTLVNIIFYIYSDLVEAYLHNMANKIGEKVITVEELYIYISLVEKCLLDRIRKLLRF